MLLSLPSPSDYPFCVVVLSKTVWSYYPVSSWKSACFKALYLRSNLRRPNYVSIKVSDGNCWYWAAINGRAIKLSGVPSK